MIEDIKRHCFRAPDIVYDHAKLSSFDALIERATARGPEAVLDYNVSYPKHEFLCYLADRRGLLLHGSNNPRIKIFEPRAQTDVAQRPVERVFATPDGIWPMYYAIVNRRRHRGSLRNYFYRRTEDGVAHRYYYFSLNKQMLERGPWRSGTVYVLPSDTFEPVIDQAGKATEEWASAVQVRPVTRLSIEPADFPFLDRVEAHDDTEVLRIQKLALKLVRDYQRVDDTPDGPRIAFSARDAVMADLEELAALAGESGLIAGVVMSVEHDVDRTYLRLTGEGATQFSATLRKNHRLLRIVGRLPQAVRMFVVMRRGR